MEHASPPPADGRAAGAAGAVASGDAAAAEAPPPPLAAELQRAASLHRTPDRVHPSDVVAVVLCLLWLAGAAIVFLVWRPEIGPIEGMPDRLFRFVVVMMAVFLPVALIWVAALAARASRTMREESARLVASVEALRKAYLDHVRTTATRSVEPALGRRIEDMVAAQRRLEQALALHLAQLQGRWSEAPAGSGGSGPHAPWPQEAEAEPDGPAGAAPDGGVAGEPGACEAEMQRDGTMQADDGSAGAAAGAGTDEAHPRLPLEPDRDGADTPAPLSTEDFIRALNFPLTVDDREGFAALRRALRDRHAAQLVRAAEDVLTLLSQDGIYMDDLRPELARPQMWRRFADGERGRAVSPLGGIRDRTALARASERMRTDPVFRDAAHHFLRVFDSRFAEFARTASDEDIIALANTRTARAFMLLGRVAGVFS